MVGRLFHKICEPDGWAWSGKERVLVEGPDSWAWRRDLVAAGYDVATCSGPSPYEQCPLLVLGACATASAAQHIVCELPGDCRGDVMDALAERYPRAPVHRSAREFLHRAAAR